MRKVFNIVKKMVGRLHKDETGQGMTEYIIIVVLIAIAVIIVASLFGKKIKELFKGSTAEIDENVVPESTE